MIRLSKSIIGNKEIEAVTKVLQKEFLGMGDEVGLFEKELSDFIGRQVVCVNTGTSALQLALQAIDLKQGDEVLIQSLTYVASFQAISATGAIPVSCEIDPEFLCIDLKDAQAKLTEKTKAIMPVHYSGSPGNLDAVYTFAQKNKLRVIEDAAHAFGSIYQERLIGNYGDIVCFSFDGIKNITCGEGGAITSGDETVLNRIKDLRLLGVIKDSDNRYQNLRSWNFDVVEQGWRYHMSNIMAAIGRVQLTRFDEFKQKRQELARMYVSNLNKVSSIQLLDIDYNTVVPHIFVILIKDGKRDDVKRKLEADGIQLGIHYKPNHLLSYYKSQYKLPLTEEIYLELTTLPLHPDLSGEDVNWICDKIKYVLQN
jgi:dTDP-4-amino-4,6-dideoxygalactose transaminase